MHHASSTTLLVLLLTLAGAAPLSAAESVGKPGLYIGRDSSWSYHLFSRDGNAVHRGNDGMASGTYEEDGIGLNRWIKATWAISADCAAGRIRKEPELEWRGVRPGTPMAAMFDAMCGPDYRAGTERP